MTISQYVAHATACASLALAPAAAAAQPAAGPQAPTYADLVDLADAARIVVHATVREQVRLPPERAPNVAPEHTRLYVEAETQALIAGNAPLGESLKYLVEVPLDSRGRAPDLEDSEVILFALPVPNRPAEIQLIAPTAQLPWSAQTESRLRPILTELVAPDVPPEITDIRDALSVEGNLVGESETQIFLDTSDGEPVSLSIVRRPGMEPVWGVSWTEIVDQSARPPQRDSLAWYRLACSLPEALPPEANLSRDAESRARAAEDYRYVREQLGPCARNRG